MARYTGPKNKLSRREGADLFEKASKMRRLTIPPGVHGPKAAGRKQSEFGLQLREKQKVKRFYGVLEKQFRRYYQLASKQTGSTGESLLRLLECRLDNLIVRAGLAPTRAMARQLIVHNHILVDNLTVNRPSYQITLGQVVTLNTKAQNIPTIVKLLENTEADIPKWLKRKAATVKIQSLPTSDDISEEFNEQAIVEFYSR